MFRIFNFIAAILAQICGISWERKARRNPRRTSFESLEMRTVLSANLVMDINPTPRTFGLPLPSIVDVNGTEFFVTNLEGFGFELWKSDGTESGTVMVKDIHVGDVGSNIRNLINFNGTLYFSANDGVHGDELWKSDGTAAGTVLVKDALVGSQSSYPRIQTFANGLIYFAANDGVHGDELWKSDGTEAGTTIVKDIQDGSSGSRPQFLTILDDTLYFNVDDGIHGLELWRSDGTEAGTTLVKDIQSGPNGSTPSFPVVVNQTIYFVANDGAHGNELWKSDGSASGTVMVKEILSGAGDNPRPIPLMNANGKLLFTIDSGNGLWTSDGSESGTINLVNGSLTHVTVVNATLFFVVDDGVHGRELWKSDGAAGGTSLVKDIWSGSNSADPNNLTNVSGTLYFKVPNIVAGADPAYPTYYEQGFELWKSDGTTNGTVLVKNKTANASYADPYLEDRLKNVNGTLFFKVNDRTGGDELWKSDGTEAGTVLVKRVRADFNTSANGILYFTNYSSNFDLQLWKSDGTEAGTVMVKRLGNGTYSSQPNSFVSFNETLYFSASNGVNRNELWKSDGTALGTKLVTNFGNNNAGPHDLTIVNSTIFFVGNDRSHGYELWKSDGTAAGTVLVADIRSGAGSSSPTNLVNVNGTLYFQADNGLKGTELWKSDGTAAGTTLVTDLITGLRGSDPSSLTNVNGTLFFTAGHLAKGRELWRSDGTAAGTVLVKDIRSGTNGANPNNLVNLNGALYFSASDGVKGYELWKSDGTLSGTMMIKDIRNGGNGSSPNGLKNINGTIYFVANDGSNGFELWKSDGTASGTVMVKDIRSGEFGSSPNGLVYINGTIYFSANDGLNGFELWKSDGTATGTVMMQDIRTGFGGAYPTSLTNVNGFLYFQANDGIHGEELWRSNGTLSGTVLIDEHVLGAGGSLPESLIAIGKHLFFSAATPEFGRELYVIPVPFAPIDIGLDNTSVNENSDPNTLIGTLSGTDPNVGDIFQFSLPTGIADNDSFRINDSSLQVNAPLDFETRNSYSISIRMTDRDGLTLDKTFSLQVLNANDAPVLDTTLSPSLPTINEDVTNPSGDTILSLLAGVTDIDPGAVKGLALTQTAAITKGKWQYSLNAGVTWIDVGTVSTASALLLPSNGTQSKLRYLPNTNVNGTVLIGYRAWDQTQGAVGTKIDTTNAGGATAYSIATETATLPIIAMNDAPVLDTSLSPTFTAVNEDTTNPTGNTIQSLLTGVSDVDLGALRGLALTRAMGASTGKWQYTLNGGAAWIDVGTLSASSALLLPSNGTQSRLRYVPKANFYGSVQVAFRAWDQTQGTAATRADVSTASLVGGTKAYSTSIDTATLEVKPVNDAPQWLRATPIALGTIRNTVANSPSYPILTRLLDANTSDLDAGALKGIAIIGIPPANAATLWYQLSGSTTWIQVSAATASSAMLLPSSARLQVRPIAGFVGTAQIRFRAWDQTTGVVGGRAALSSVNSTGGSTAFSTGIGIADLAITV